MHHGSGPQNVQHQLQRSRAFAGSEGEEQQAHPNPPQSPATPFAPAVSPSAPQSPGSRGMEAGLWHRGSGPSFTLRFLARLSSAPSSSAPGLTPRKPHSGSC